MKKKCGEWTGADSHNVLWNRVGSEEPSWARQMHTSPPSKQARIRFPSVACWLQKEKRCIILTFQCLDKLSFRAIVWRLSLRIKLDSVFLSKLLLVNICLFFLSHLIRQHNNAELRVDNLWTLCVRVFLKCLKTCVFDFLAWSPLLCCHVAEMKNMFETISAAKLLSE